MNHDNVLLYAVGDVSVNREKPESIMALAQPTLKQADVLFGQMECHLSERGAPGENVSISIAPSHPRNVAALTCVGFDVMAAASNHTLDFGKEALRDTVANLRKNGIIVVGVGENIDEARQPAIIERKATRIGFLDYCTVLPKGYEARPDKPGAAPLRASTAYEQVDWQAGMPPRVLSFAHQEDLAAMLNDIKKLRPEVDVLVLSMHWGIHYIPSLIAMYQKEVAHAAIDAGVDLILGHHTHILKGIEVYKGKVIFHSLANFAYDHGPIEKVRLSPTWKNLRWDMDPEYPSYPFPADSRKTIIAKCVMSNKKIQNVRYLPVMINKQSQPEVLSRSDKRSAEVFDYMAWLCKDQQLATAFSRDGDEVLICT
ncbi:MAG: CapA family protein [Chloroflexi bacterium]|nr:CapA family protein [Chloroflexota bacterium]